MKRRSDATPLTDRQIGKIAHQNVVLTDHRRFKRVQASFWRPLEMVQWIFIDWKTDEADIRRLSAAGMAVEVVHPEE